MQLRKRTGISRSIKVKLLQRLLKQDILQDLRQDIWKKTHILTKWWYQKPLLQNACSTSILQLELLTQTSPDISGLARITWPRS